jgi:hypothetical protein
MLEGWDGLSVWLCVRKTCWATWAYEFCHVPMNILLVVCECVPGVHAWGYKWDIYILENITSPPLSPHKKYNEPHLLAPTIPAHYLLTSSPGTYSYNIHSPYLIAGLFVYPK